MVFYHIPLIGLYPCGKPYRKRYDHSEV